MGLVITGVQSMFANAAFIIYINKSNCRFNYLKGMLPNYLPYCLLA
jgi:hypothetical protein